VQVPDQLGLLAHDQRDCSRKWGCRRDGVWPSTSTSPLVGCNKPDSSLSVVVLPAPLGPRKPTRSPPGDREAHAVDRADGLVAPVYERPDRRREAGRSLVDPEVLRQLAGVDHGARTLAAMPVGESGPRADRARGPRDQGVSRSVRWPGLGPRSVVACGLGELADGLERKAIDRLTLQDLFEQSRPDLRELGEAGDARGDQLAARVIAAAGSSELGVRRPNASCAVWIQRSSRSRSTRDTIFQIEVSAS